MIHSQTLSSNWQEDRHFMDAVIQRFWEEEKQTQMDFQQSTERLKDTG
jgi:hypothetical protein